MKMRTLFCLLAACLLTTPLQAQELNAKVTINRQQVSNTKSDVFTALEQTVTRFLNERKWTQMEYRDLERIQCTFAITVDTYSEPENAFTGSLLLSSTRPVWGSSYTTTVFNYNDKEFSFNFNQFDQLEFRDDQVDNNLTAMLAFWAYVIIGMDMDSMSSMGGTDILRRAQDVCNNAESMGYPGWTAFGDTKNRYAIINDYLDGSMEPFRKLQYTYYRSGLDKMSEDTEAGRKAIRESLDMLKEARENKSLSSLPQIFTDYKRDELVSIFTGQGSSKDREEVYDILFRLNPSQNNYWEKIKQ